MYMLLTDEGAGTLGAGEDETSKARELLSFPWLMPSSPCGWPVVPRFPPDLNVSPDPPLI